MELLQVLPFKKTTIVRGEGSRVFDSNGKVYIDLLSGYWCNVLGYSHLDFILPVSKQISRLTNVMSSFTTIEVEEALKELEKILPPQLNRVTFLSSGSEAVDLALKMARAATGRTGVVVNESGYYGATSYPFSLSAAGRTAKYLPDPGEVHRVQAPHCYRCPYGSRENCKSFKCLDSLQKLVEDMNSNIAAIMYEPILGYGILVPPIGYGAKLQKYAKALRAYLIAEEVTTAPAKTGHWFAFQHDGIVPDILVLGKGIGNGFPVSLVVTTSEVEERCLNTVRHVQSHQNDALSGKVVKTVLSIIKEQNLVEHVARKGEYWLKELKKLQAEFSIIEDVRGRGLIFGLQLSKDKALLGDLIQNKLFDEGFITDFHSGSNTFRFFPPYVITVEEIDSFNEALRNVLTSIEETSTR